MEHVVPVPVLSAFQALSLLDVLVLGSLSTMIVGLLVFIVVRGERRSAARIARQRARAVRTRAKVVQSGPRHTGADDDEMTIITMSFEELQGEDAADLVLPEPEPRRAPVKPKKQVWREDDTDRAIPIVADPGAADDEPTRNTPMILVSAAAQTDRGKKRERNEDRYAVFDDANLYVVADGMGGYAGGQIASQLCCDTIVAAYAESDLAGPIAVDVPRRAGELALAIQMANRAVYQRGQADSALRGMGTTVVCARFAPRKGRLYIGHVGDSRCYRLRDGQLQQLTEDHTMARFGLKGRHGAALSRAVGVGPGVNVDLIIAEPRVDDVYLLCSDGLTKMLKDPDQIRDVLVEQRTIEGAVERLVQMANDAGGKDNVTVLLVAVKDATGLRRAYSLTPVSPPRV